jgi:hypothetical protein
MSFSIYFVPEGQVIQPPTLTVGQVLTARNISLPMVYFHHTKQFSVNNLLHYLTHYTFRFHKIISWIINNTKVMENMVFYTYNSSRDGMWC